MKTSSFFKRLFVIVFLLLLFASICAIKYINTVSAHIGESVLRLHVIANSNSSEDQNLKYLVRDKLIEYMNKLSINCKSKEEAILLVKENLDAFKQLAQNVILENNFDYDVAVEIGNFEFPTKDYGDISLPAGLYDALEVKIGKAEGQNWWCVMFPPLCFIDVSTGIASEESKNLMHNNLSDEEFYLISENAPDIKFKFKLIELFNSMTSTLTAKK